jgi:hypothetical protein
VIRRFDTLLVVLLDESTVPLSRGKPEEEEEVHENAGIADTGVSRRSDL